MVVTFANACYSGGGIYLYLGTLSNGLHFIADDTKNDFSICLCDVLPDFENMGESSFFDAHVVECLDSSEPATRKLYNSIIAYIVTNRPNGNYQTDELLARMK